MKIYGMGKSRSFRCLWAAEEAGLDYEYVAVEFGSDAEQGSQSEAYRKISSQGKVPALIDGDLLLTESAAIVNYLATKNPQKSLMPTDPIQRARYDQLAFFVLSDLEQPLWTNGKHRFAIPEEYRVPQVLSTTIWEFNKSQEALVALIGANPEYAFANHFSMIDVLVAHTLAWAKGFKYELFAGFDEYRERIYARPACQAALKRIGE